MVQINYSDVIVATVAAFIFSAVYYIVLNKLVVADREKYTGHKPDGKRTMNPTKVVVEFVRTFVLGLFIAYAVSLMNFLYVQQALLLAFWLWLAFPVVLLVGSVMYERFPTRLAIIHAGDWLAKLLIFTVILTYWR